MGIHTEVFEQVSAEIEAEHREELADRVRAQHEMLKDVQLGKECSQFLATGVGAFILSRAIEGREAAIEDLINVSPNNTEKIDTLQREARVPALMFTWLNEAIVAGIEAGDQINLDMEDYQDG